MDKVKEPYFYENNIQFNQEKEIKNMLEKFAYN